MLGTDVGVKSATDAEEESRVLGTDAGVQNARYDVGVQSARYWCRGTEF